MKKLILGAFVLCTAVSAGAAQGPLWLRNAAISPDGTQIAFTYKGDIYIVAANGGQARALTTNPAYDSYPTWSPDGSRIAFSSLRDGSEDVYVVDAAGGTASRLTSDSGVERPLGWADSSTVLFSANMTPDRLAAQGPFAQQVYSVGVEGGRPRMFSTMPMAALSVNPAGDVLYQDRKGYENAYRKHETSSSTGDIRMRKDGHDSRLTTFAGNDQNPVWTGAYSFVYLSEEDGTLNVYSRNLSGSEKRRLTAFANHPVRSLSASADGSRLAFSWNGELYTLVPGAEPQKVDVSIVADDYDRDLVEQTRNGGHSTAALAVSPGGKEVAFVIRGDVYTTSVEYPTTKRITSTPGQERVVAFANDGRTLVYDSERDGQWQLFMADIDDPDSKTFTYADGVAERHLYTAPDGRPAQQPVASPDGKKVAFLEDRTELRVIDLDSKAVTTVLPGQYNYSYSDGDINYVWSPDSRRLLVDYIGGGGWNNSDIAMVSTDGKEVVDLTLSGYADGNPRWALDGEAVTWQSGRYGMKAHGSWGNETDVQLMALTPEAFDKMRLTDEEAALLKEAKEEADKAESDNADSKGKKTKKGKKDKAKAEEKPPVDFDLDNRAVRTLRLTPSSGRYGDYVLAADGSKLYFVASDATGSAKLMERNLRKGDTKVLASDVRGGIIPDAKVENIYVMQGSGMKKVELSSGTVKDIAYEGDYSRSPSGEREYIYDHMLSQVRDKFYDKNLHGVDWQAYGENYRRFLPHISNNEDFAILLSEILGELNASHTGGRHYPPVAYSTAVLGAFFDDAYDGDGLKVTEAIAGGPLSTKAALVLPGEIVMAIDGRPIAKGGDYSDMLRDKAGKKVSLTVLDASGKERTVHMRPISKGEQNSLLYRRWVRRNAAVVDSLSEGKVGYVHVKGMDTESFQTVYSEMLGKYRNAEAIIVDTRWNGGGWLHNDLALLLGGKEYVRFVPRGQYIGSEPFSQWTKPSVMLVNEANYSDAHGSPFVYQTLGLGDIVGAPVPGTMTAVWWETQIDPSIVFGIPQVTSMDMKGNVLENHQLTPDVEVYNSPDEVAAGTDAQLAKAVEVLLKRIKN